MAQAVVPGCSLSDDPGFCRAPNPQPSHEFVERASTTAIASEPGPPQDFGPRDVGILAQPLRDLRRVVRHRGRAARRLWSPPLPLRHLMEPSMTRTPEQIRYRDLQETDFHQGAECSEPYPAMEPRSVLAQADSNKDWELVGSGREDHEDKGWTPAPRAQG